MRNSIRNNEFYIKVRVTVEAKRDAVKLRKEHEFDVCVREPAERNLANVRVRELMALQYSCPLSGIRIASGHRSSSKILIVDLE